MSHVGAISGIDKLGGKMQMFSASEVSGVSEFTDGDPMHQELNEQFN
jgi:hypothetical protein